MVATAARQQITQNIGKFLKILRNVVIGIVLLLIGIFFILNTPFVQTWITQKIAGYYSEELNTEVKVGSVRYEFWRTLAVKDIFVADTTGDSLASIGALRASIGSVDRHKGVIGLDRVALEKADIRLKKYKGAEQNNLHFIVDHFSDTTATDTTGWKVKVGQVALDDCRFLYEDRNREKQGTGLLDFAHLDIHGFDLELDSLQWAGDSLSGTLEELALHELNSNLKIREFTGELGIGPGGIGLGNMRLLTRFSDLNGDLRFLTNDYADYGNFNDSVRIRANFLDSWLQLDDIGHFAPALQNVQQGFRIAGKFRGTVSNLKGRDLHIAQSSKSYMRGDLDLTGLPNMKETFMSVEVEDLRTSKSWIEQLSVIPAENGKCVEIPENFAPFGEVRFKGDFKGFMNDFVAFGVLSSDIGKVRTNVSFKRENEAGEIAWNGKLETKDLDMGALLGTSAMGPLNSTLEVDATGMTMERIRADIEGDVDRFRINGYDYHNMRVEGIFEQHRFQGMIRGSGEHYDLDFKGMVDLASARPQFEFTANMAGDPTHLNLGDRDSSAHLSLRMEVDASGNRPENVRGKVEIRDILYEEKGRQYPFADILVEARENEDQQTLSFRSGFLEATFQGKFKTAQLADDLTRQVYQALPALRDRPPLQLSPDQHFDFRFKVGDTEQLSELFFPDIRMASNAVLEGKYDSDEGRFEFICFIPKLELYGRSFRGTKLTVNKVGDTLQVQGTGEALQATKDVAFKDLRLDARAARDCVQVSADWGQTGRTERNEFAFTTLVKGTDHFELDIGSGRFFFGGLEWGLNENGRVLIDSSSYMADRVELTHEDRFIKINGKASRDPADRMTLNVNDFRLSYLAPLIGAEETELGGVVNLKGGVSNVYEKPEIDASAEVTELVFNDTPLGDLTLNGEWLDAQKKMTLSGGLKRDGKERLNIAGAYRTAEGVEPLNVALKARKLDLAFMNAFLAGGVSGFRGSVDGQLDLTGSLDAPVVTGGITTKGVSVLIDHLNTRYFIQDESKIRFHEEMITMDYVPIFDEEDHEARATATVVHQHFSDWNYNLFVEQMDDFLCMNTTKDMNDLYYGTGYVDGEAEVSGYGDQLNIQVTAKTEKGTRINIPLSGSKKVTQENFIEFVDHQDTGKVEARDVNLEGVDMSFELDVTPDANFRLIFDETVGDVMEGRGSGNINMEIDSKGKFEMFGQYTVKEGEYLFTLRDVINKRFQVESGGTIQWFGDPYKAALDLNANYSLRSSLYDVIPAGVSDRSSYSKRVPVNLVMHLSNNLTDPDIDFDIELPTVGDDTRSLVQSSMDTEEKVNQQAFSLLLLGRFIPQMKASDRSADAGFSQNTSTELLSNQLSNWLSSISDEFDIGVNYRPGNAISSEEVAVAMSTKLFNDRLTLSGNFGVSSDDQVQKQDQSVVVGDFRAEYDITEDGKFRLKAYNESNDNRLSALDQADYTQGVGIFYREEFDTAAELINKMGGLFRREEKKKEKAD